MRFGRIVRYHPNSTKIKKMSTILANSVLNIVQTFSPEELEAFSIAFAKLQKPVTNCKPKTITPKMTLPTLEYCINVIRAKNSIQAQGKLA